MNILFVCGREPTYTRNETILNALIQDHNVTQITCSNNNYLLRHIVIFFKLITTNKRNIDLIFVGFYGQVIMMFIKIFVNKPIIFDAFISTYQTLCFDRKKFAPKSFFGKLAYFIDKQSCKYATKIILDTDAHCDYFSKTFDIPKSKLSRLFVGANESMFYPMKGKVNKIPVIFTYSAYQPLHGTEYVVEAAKIIGRKASFVIVGSGSEKEKIEKLVKDYRLTNVSLLNWLPYKQLPEKIANADICLGGHFADTEKAKMVIAGKTFQFVAMGKATVVSGNTANREFFGQTDAAYYSESANAIDLAKVLNNLIDDAKLRAEIGKIQARAYKEKASSIALCKKLNEIVCQIA